MSKRDTLNKSIERFIGIEEDVESELDNLEDQDERENFEIVKYDPVDSRVPAEQRDSDVYDDYQYTRTILRGLIERGTGALEGALMLAKESEHPRAFEVSSTLMKNISDMSKDLMALHKHMDEGNGGGGESGAKTVNNTQNNYYTSDGKKQKGVDDLLDDLDDEDNEQK